MGLDPLVLPMRGVVTIMNDSYSQLDGQSLSINHREVEELIEMDSLLLSMQSVGNIMEDSPTELHMQQETVIDLNVAIRVTQRIYRLARSAYDIMSVLTG
ncbi:uncharacterized protein LOC111077390 [Drosophila obscura]|uniref:uncharacterized protein LOC111077390 n=1 Tax=Drosophila obscura TaxID=7282 RepID=UPI001BB0FBDA|nr:uncharacterized protein LOC111077390 [Drosophila obscura]